MKDKTLFEKEVNVFSNDDIGMYYCGKRINTQNHVYGPQIRNHYLFVLVNAGEAKLHGKRDTKLCAHDMLVMCPGEKIFYEAYTPWSIQWAGLYGTGVETLIKSLNISGDNPIIKLGNYREVEQVMEELYICSKHNSKSTNLKIISLIFKFFSLLHEERNSAPNIDYVTDAVKIIDYNFSNDITVEKLAQSFGLNSSYFTRIFTQKVHMSPKKYILEKRMEYAKELLESTSVSVSEIANTVGFSDQLYFSRIFKKMHGCSPKAYREIWLCQHSD